LQLIITDQVVSALYPGGALFKSWSALPLSIWCRSEKWVALYLYSSYIPLQGKHDFSLMSSWCIRLCYLFVCLLVCSWRDSPQWGQDLLIHEVSRSHTTTHHSR